MKELASTFNALLQDKRVRSEQSKYENINRQKSSVTSKYKRIYQEFLDLEAGLQAAKQWYHEMKDTVESLDKNVETFVNNRRSEGAQLLNQIEADRASSANGQADRERERHRSLMSMEPSTSPSIGGKQTRSQSMYTTTSPSTRYPPANTVTGQYQTPPSPFQPAHPKSAHPQSTFGAQNGGFFPPQQQVRQELYLPPKPTPPAQGGYNPAMHPPISPPPNQTSFPQNIQAYGRPVHQQPSQQQYMGPSYVPPPPPVGPYSSLKPSLF
jgi:hypothetical protein